MEFLNQIAQSNPFGTVTAPTGLGGVADLPRIVSAILKTLIMGAAIYSVFNFVLAGYAYISSSGDPKGIQMATAKIWQTAIGIAIAAGALLIAGVVGQILFQDPSYLINIQIITI